MKRNSLISCISVLGLTKNALFDGFGFVIARHAFFFFFFVYCLFGGWKLRGNVCKFSVFFFLFVLLKFMGLLSRIREWFAYKIGILL
jgi:hypothetical protein